jgi:hypothetical protein
MSETRGIDGRTCNRMTDGWPTTINKDVHETVLEWFVQKQLDIVEQMTIVRVISKLRELCTDFGVVCFA